MTQKSTPNRLFILAGEPSGDAHGEHLMQSIDAQFFGIGGPKMRALGLDVTRPMEDLSVMGLWPVVKSLPRLIRLFRETWQRILKEDPEGVILIDYPVFNLMLMKKLRKKGYRGKIIQYIAPSVWAHGKRRAETIKACADLLLVIYPFEKAYFPHMQVEVIKNPLAEAAKESDRQLERKPLIALFPGSRRSEIAQNLPLLKGVAKQLQERHPELEIAISAAHARAAEQIGEQMGESSERDTETLMRTAQIALAVSGTVTLELALRETPTVVCYKIPRLMYFIGKWIARINLPYLCIVNILMGRQLFPEFFETQPNVDAMAQAAEELMQDKGACLKGMRELQGQFAEGLDSGEVITETLKRGRGHGSDHSSRKACVEA